MYKILTKLNTKHRGAYCFYLTKDTDGTIIEYATESIDEAKSMALEVLKQVGYDEVRVVDDKPFYIEINNVVDGSVQSEDIKQALSLMAHIGTDNLFLTNDASYEIDLCWGLKPEPEIPTYYIEVRGEDGLIATPTSLEVQEGEAAVFTIDMADQIKNFHLMVNGEEFTEGLPPHITYENNLLTINDIHNDLVVVLIKN